MEPHPRENNNNNNNNMNETTTETGAWNVRGTGNLDTSSGVSSTGFIYYGKGGYTVMWALRQNKAGQRPPLGKLLCKPTQ